MTGITSAQGQAAFIRASINGTLRLHVVVGLTSSGMVHRVRNEARDGDTSRQDRVRPGRPCRGARRRGHRGPTPVSALCEPTTNTGSNLPACRVAFGDHVTAPLLDDGRVMVAGQDGDFKGSGRRCAENRTEVHSPPFLFRGARPAVLPPPTELPVRSGFDIDQATGTNSAVIREGGSWRVERPLTR